MTVAREEEPVAAQRTEGAGRPRRGKRALAQTLVERPAPCRRLDRRWRAPLAGGAGSLARARAAASVLLAAALAVGALCSCAPPLPAAAPRVLSVSPAGTGVVPDTVVVVVTFSEPVDPAGVADGRYLALARGEDAKEVAGAASAATGIGPGAPVVPVRVALADGGRRAELRPVEPLAPDADHAVVVGTGIRSAGGRSVLDPTGRKRVFTAAFRTGPVPDRTGPTPSWTVPPHGPVPTNLKEVRILLSEPVTGTLALDGTPTEPTAPGSGDAGWPGAGSATEAPGPVEMALRLLGPLPSGGSLSVSLDGLRDAAGNRPLALEPLPISHCRDDAPPALDPASVRMLPGETSLAAQAAATEVARLGLEVAVAPGDEPCGAVPGPPAARVAWGAFAPCPGWDPCGPAARCTLSAEADGLCPGHAYQVRIHLEDLAGNRAAPGPWHMAATGAAVARPVLTEVLADAEAPEAGGEYVEVANLGSGSARLTGFRLAKRSASGAVTRCTLEPLEGVLPPGAHGLVVSGAWDGRYRLPPGIPLFRCGTGALAGGIANDRPPELALEGPDGGVVSGLGWTATSLRCTGRSLERIHPAGPDAAANLACSRTVPGTPGACNGATPPEECPRRPW